MKKHFALILALAFVSTVVFVGCEKKQAPQPAAQPSVTPAAPAPAAPVAAPPAAKPAPAKPAKK